MAIGVLQARPLSFAEANPFAKGREQGQQSVSNLIAQHLASLQAKEEEAKLPYAGALAKAMAERQQAMASLPFGGANVPGAAGQIVGLEMIRQKYGDGSPQYLLAKKTFDLGLEGDQSRINYQNVLANTAPTRSLTPTGKSIIEQANVRQGNAPTGQNWSKAISPGMNQGAQPQISNVAAGDNQSAAQPGVSVPQEIAGNNSTAPASSESLANTYELLRQKGSTDPQARAKNLQASNIDKTIAMINEDDLTRYAGTNSLAKYVEAAKAPFSKQSKEYDNYLVANKMTELLATQVRQFYGESIQPSLRKDLQEMTDPSTWKNNPELAKKLYRSVVTTLRNETSTYRDAMKSTKPYEEQKQEGYTQNGNPAAKNAEGLIVNLNGFKSPQEFNDWYHGQTDEVKAAVQRQLHPKGRK